jgi:hypothetical protein
MLPVLSAAGILDIGLSSQIRAGRQLSPADFANIGLNAPAGLWNLSDLSDASGNGRALSNKGAVPFASGINGVVNTAAQFSGGAGQALYISDTGAADPFRIKTGSWGCWFRTAKKGVAQNVMGKLQGNLPGYFTQVQAGNQLSVGFYDGTAYTNIITSNDVADDVWHFGVATYDGTYLKLYSDGMFVSQAVFLAGVIPNSAIPFNIGNLGADASTAGANGHFGRVDEAFVTADVLSEDQVRSLYCAKISHTLGAVPARVVLNVRRRKKGVALAVADFPTQPLRLYNFSAASLGDQGSNNQALINNGGAVSVAGADGSTGNAFNFSGAQSLSSTDTGLPAGVASRSYGCWFKTISTTGYPGLLAWGASVNVNDTKLMMSSGIIISASAGDNINGLFAADGQWHQAIAVEDNAAIDGVKRKLYLDGHLVGNSNVLNPITLGGANKLKIAIQVDGTQFFIGQIDGAFVCDYALTADQVHALYAKGVQTLSPSPKNVGDHVEGMDAANLYAIFDTLESQNQIDLAVA